VILYFLEYDFLFGGTYTMVKHIVMWKFRDIAEGKSKDENISIATDMLYSLVGKISEIKKM
jgi:hypothetical protein